MPWCLTVWGGVGFSGGEAFAPCRLPRGSACLVGHAMVFLCAGAGAWTGEGWAGTGGTDRNEGAVPLRAFAMVHHYDFHASDCQAQAC